MCTIYTVFRIYFESIQYYFTEINIVQKLKYTNNVGVLSWQFLDKIKSGQQYRKLSSNCDGQKCLWTNLVGIFNVYEVNFINIHLN